MTRKILIIDDDDDIREATQLCLEIVGNWQIVTANSGKEGLIVAISQQPALILLDVMMPDMDGLETLKQLQVNDVTKDIPVMLLTAKAHFEPFVTKDGVSIPALNDSNNVTNLIYISSST